MSNVATLTRLGLFCETARVFLKELRKESRGKFDAVPEGLRRRYLGDDGEKSSYDDARSSEGRRRLAVCARDVWRLVDRYRGDPGVTALGSYGLLKRLFDEQCEVVKEPVAPADGDADLNEPPAPVVVKDAKLVRSDSLQTPHDPSLTYSGKKGKAAGQVQRRFGLRDLGAEVQVAETCGNGSKPEVITYAEVTRSSDSDESATVPVVDDLARRESAPGELAADTNYLSDARQAARPRTRSRSTSAASSSSRPSRGRRSRNHPRRRPGTRRARSGRASSTWTRMAWRERAARRDARRSRRSATAGRGRCGRSSPPIPARHALSPRGARRSVSSTAGAFSGRRSMRRCSQDAGGMSGPRSSGGGMRNGPGSRRRTRNSSGRTAWGGCESGGYYESGSRCT